MSLSLSRTTTQNGQPNDSSNQLTDGTTKIPANEKTRSISNLESRDVASEPREMDAATARATYLKILGGGTMMVVILIFCIFSIFWGALWKIPAHNLPGWIVDFDGGEVGQAVAQGLQSPAAAASSKITWSTVSASEFPGGMAQLADAVKEERTWVAISINEGASSRLLSSLSQPNASYDGSSAITVIAAEARNENAFRSFIQPSVQASLGTVSTQFALAAAGRLAASNVSTVLSQSPQTLVQPISYTIQNLAPFDIPVATAVTFVGLLYQLILAFFVVMIGSAARVASGYETRLSIRNLVLLRIGSAFAAYFVLSLFYSLLNLAFQVDFTRKFGHGGFVIFWMLNFAAMLSVGLALESMITLLTQSFVAFFMLTWIITNVSVCVFPIEVMPKIYHYGYAAPFYNVSKAIRTIIFGTRNRVGFNFAILIVWIVISCITLPIFVWLRSPRRGQQSKTR